MTCPCCNAQLTEAQVKSIWAVYCNSRITPEGRAKAKTWKAHSEKAGNRCRCVDCIKLRELRAQQLERVLPKRKPITEEDLTWEAILQADKTAGYDLLLRRETTRQIERRKNKLRRKISEVRYEAKLRALKERAQREGVYAKILKEAKARADAAWSEKSSEERSSPTKTETDGLS